MSLQQPIPSQKRPYRAPKLVVYGDVRQLTQSGSGTSNESGGTEIDANKVMP